MKILSIEGIEQIIEVALEENVKKGAGYFSWKNSPFVENNEFKVEEGWGETISVKNLTSSEAKSIFDAKINSAYTERLNMTLGTLVSIINNGYNVSLVQFQKDDSAPFDADGWVVVVVETMPVFHLAPWDLPMEKIAHLVNLLPDDKDPEVSWKGTNKIGEFRALLMASLTSGLDIVSIAKEASQE